MAAKRTKTTSKQPPLKKAGLRPQLVHHRHSFKRLSVHHTSYSLTALMLLFVAIFSVGWSAFVSAADGGSYTTRAVVPADPLTEAATIDTPDDGQVFATPEVTVTGDCPANSYVSLIRNNIYAGSAICNGLRWSLQLNLVAGNNILQAQDYNITDAAGPPTASRSVRYDPPTTAATHETPVSASSHTTTNDDDQSPPTAESVEPLVLSGSFSFQGVQVGQTLQQTFTISGGSKPYALTVDWGDGSTDLVSQADAGTVTVSHVYTVPGSAEHSAYTIKIAATDTIKQRALLQTLAIVTLRPNATVGASTAGGAGGTASGINGMLNKLTGNSAYQKFWKVAGPTYAVSTVALSGFWIGQHRELELLRQQAVRLHKRRPL